MARLRKLGKRASDFEAMCPSARAQNVLSIIYHHILREADRPLSAAEIQDRWPERYSKRKPTSSTISGRLIGVDWVEVHGKYERSKTFSYRQPE
jgi:hypothetical protein